MIDGRDPSSQVPAPGRCCGAPAPAPVAGILDPSPAAASVETDASAAPVPALAFEHVRFQYAGSDRFALEDVDFAVPEGAFALLVGDTGSGKSTLLSLAKPEIAPNGTLEGSVRVLGCEARSMSVAESAQAVGYVFQNPDNQLVCESVWHEMAFGLENLGTGRDAMRRRVAETCYFLGIESWFRQDIDKLSGGRKQLVALGSVLAMRPRVLLLDEPTAMLDPIAEKTFLHALFRINRELGCTVLVATHEPRAFADYVTEAYRLDGGRIERLSSFDGLRELPVLLDPGDRATGGDRPGAGTDAALAPPLADRAPEGSVRLSRAWFRYGRASDWVLRGFELSVRRGEVHALVGGNGSGKSTVLALVAGALGLRRGSCENVLRARQVLLPQDPRALLTGDSVAAELMEWAPAWGYDEERAASMLAYVGLRVPLERHPYDLSGGQQQLLALAKLLLANPRLLLLDEPTKGLDAGSRRTFARILDRVRAEGGTVLMASHDLDFVRQVADRVTMVFDGEAACTQETEEFFRDNVYYRP